jgi:hypothetical protein
LNAPVSDEEVIRAVKWRYRTCNYLFRLGFGWIIAGVVLSLFPTSLKSLGESAGTVELVGFGIFSSAVALTLAIYRCPVCDRFLSRFRPQKNLCPHCGAKVR